jgi:hypothetical protein
MPIRAQRMLNFAQEVLKVSGTVGLWPKNPKKIRQNNFSWKFYLPSGES